MRLKPLNKALAATAIATVLVSTTIGVATTTLTAASAATRAAQTVLISTGRGQLVRLSKPMSDLFVADPQVADVQVRSPTQLYIFGKKTGETTIFATARDGQTIWSADVRVGTNLENLAPMLKLAMPEADISATPMNGVVLLTGTVLAPGDIETAQSMTQTFLGKDVQVINRIKTATPQQVALHVKIAEVNRELTKSIGFNILTRDATGGFQFGIAQGRAGAVTLSTPTAGGSFTGVEPGTTIGMFGKFLGLDIGSALDLAENDGLVTTLAEPNLTALSGETASFLAGGEIPVPVPGDNRSITIQYKQYGVSLAFTPIVMSDGRISMRVRPEVSQLTAAGSIVLDGFNIPGISTRRAETTIELGSGQSFMIGGLLNNNHTNEIDKAPGLGDLPIIGALFRSRSFKRNESELVIVVTPYLVKPTTADKIALPTDGYEAPTEAEQLLLGQSFSGKTGATRAKPSRLPAAGDTARPAPETKTK